MIVENDKARINVICSLLIHVNIVKRINNRTHLNHQGVLTMALAIANIHETKQQQQQ